MFEGGPVKTPVLAAAGWFTWASVKGVLEAVVLVGTAVTVCIHVFNAIMRQWCPHRRQRDKNVCLACKLAGTVFCPIKTRDED